MSTTATGLNFCVCFVLLFFPLNRITVKTCIFRLQSGETLMCLGKVRCPYSFGQLVYISGMFKAKKSCRSDGVP